MLLDIVILPPRDLRRKLGSLARKLQKTYQVYYVVDNKHLIPHISLFHLRINKKQLRKLMMVISSLIKCKNIKGNKLVWLGTSTWGDSPTIYYKRNRWLTDLNESVIREVAHLRSGAMPWLPKRNPTMNEKRLRENYGVHYNIGKTFNPHITFAKMVYSKDAIIITKLISKYAFSFPLKTIALCEVNRNHQVTRIIKRFRIQ